MSRLASAVVATRVTAGALWAAAGVLLGAAAPPGSLAAPGEAIDPAAGLELGVVAFEAVAPPGAEVPDLATLLADRIGTRGVGRVVGPSQLSAPASAEPSEEDIRLWAAQAGVDAVVVGRTTRIGSQLSVDVRLRSAESGAVSGTYVAEIQRPDDLGDAIDRLAAQIIEGSVAMLVHEQPPAAPVEDPPLPPPPRAQSGPVREESPPFGFDSDKPFSIRSESLEAVQKQGARKLVFSENVEVQQEDLRMTSHHLEAFYPANASQPDRLVATGSVRLVQGTREARCDEATYDRGKDRLTCRGHAELRDGGDRVSGAVIEFDLARETVQVKGGASVVILPDHRDEQR